MNYLSWAPIRYRDFYDFPRMFVVEYGNRVYLFDCPFDDELDEYGGDYAIYVMPFDTPVPDSGSWEMLRHCGDLLGRVPTGAVTFDETRRRAIDSRVIDLLRASGWA